MIWVHKQCMVNCQTSTVDVKCIKFKERILSVGVGWASFRWYYLLKYKSHMWPSTYWHPGSWNPCSWYWKHNLILIYKSLQFDPEVIMIMSSSWIIPALNESALFSGSPAPWRWSWALLAVTSFLGSCNCPSLSLVSDWALTWCFSWFCNKGICFHMIW